MKAKNQYIYYILGDYFAAMLAWISFYVFRRLYILEPIIKGTQIFMISQPKFWIALIGIPLMWIIFYRLLGQYNNIYRRSAILIIWQTLLASIIGIIIIFFFIILDDAVISYKDYYYSIIYLLLPHILLTLTFRGFYTFFVKKKIKSGKINFPTAIIGNYNEALKLYKEIKPAQKKYGYKIIGYIAINQGQTANESLKYLGNYNNLEKIVEQENINEVIIPQEAKTQEQIKDIMIRLLNKNVYVNIIPEMYGIYSGRIKLDSILSFPILKIPPNNMSEWQQNIKRIADVGISIFVLTVFSPLYLFLSLGVRLSGKGTIIYSHKRIGRYGKPFSIYKFRSMTPDAEKGGPALSSKNDPRITKFGRFMRKYRLDELPQFFNVLIGDMSLVGPRPERQFYIDQIVKISPHYLNLHSIRPGITSLGQVKYGYAENIDQMIQRMRYDILYLQNMSLFLDIKILAQTIFVVLGSKGV